MASNGFLPRQKKVPGAIDCSHGHLGKGRTKIIVGLKCYMTLAGTMTGTIRRKAYLLGIGEEGVAAEEQITNDGTFADKPSLNWTGEE